jgi:hypothetical protein
MATTTEVKLILSSGQPPYLGGDSSSESIIEEQIIVEKKNGTSVVTLKQLTQERYSDIKTAFLKEFIIDPQISPINRS